MLTNITRTHYNETNHDDYIFEIDGRKTVIFHVGVCYADAYTIGVSGKRLVNPTRSLGRLGEVFEYTSHYPANYSNFFNHVQKIISLPNISVTFKSKLIETLYHNPQDRKLEWKDIFNFIKNCTENEFEKYYSIKEGIARQKLTVVLKKYGFEEYKEYIDPNHLEYFEHKAFREGFKNAVRDHYAAPQAAVLAALGVEKDELENFGIFFETWNYRSALRNLYNKMNGLTDLIKKMELGNYKITNVERDYEELRTKWDKERTQIEDGIFNRLQTEKNLHFETENFEIFVPTAREEVAKIGNEFANCANSHAWDSYIINGAYHIVVVRNKISHKGEVYVDINFETLQIRQYYGRFNDSIRNPELLDFKEKYQEYLNSLT